LDGVSPPPRLLWFISFLALSALEVASHLLTSLAFYQVGVTLESPAALAMFSATKGLVGCLLFIHDYIMNCQTCLKREKRFSLQISMLINLISLLSFFSVAAGVYGIKTQHIVNTQGELASPSNAAIMWKTVSLVLLFASTVFLPLFFILVVFVSRKEMEAKGLNLRHLLLGLFFTSIWLVISLGLLSRHQAPTLKCSVIYLLVWLSLSGCSIIAALALGLFLLWVLEYVGKFPRTEQIGFRSAMFGFVTFIPLIVNIVYLLLEDYLAYQTGSGVFTVFLGRCDGSQL